MVLAPLLPKTESIHGLIDHDTVTYINSHTQAAPYHGCGHRICLGKRIHYRSVIIEDSNDRFQYGPHDFNTLLSCIVALEFHDGILDVGFRPCIIGLFEVLEKLGQFGPLLPRPLIFSECSPKRGRHRLLLILFVFPRAVCSYQYFRVPQEVVR